MALYDAEECIAEELGWYPAPKWIAQEIHQFPRFHRRELYQLYGRNVRGQQKSVRTDFARVSAPGQRAVSLVGTATTAGGTLVYSDADGDGFVERATITLPTTLTNKYQIKAYTAGYDGVQVWEIRDPFYREISGGSVELRFYVWQMVRPELWEFFPTTDTEHSADLAIDLTDTDNLVTSVDVYREYNDVTATSVTFYWEPTPPDNSCTDLAACEACELITQDGCLHIRDAERGIVVPTPATYSAADAAWSQESYTGCRDPDFCKIWYYAGYMSNQELAGRAEQEFVSRWAHPIAWLATARLERPFCSCGNVFALGRDLRTDLALTGESSHQVPFSLLDNPFGTRKGEVMAWKRVRMAKKRISGGGAV